MCLLFKKILYVLIEPCANKKWVYHYEEKSALLISSFYSIFYLATINHKIQISIVGPPGPCRCRFFSSRNNKIPNFKLFGTNCTDLWNFKRVEKKNSGIWFRYFSFHSSFQNNFVHLVEIGMCTFHWKAIEAIDILWVGEKIGSTAILMKIE